MDQGICNLMELRHLKMLIKLWRILRVLNTIIIFKESADLGNADGNYNYGSLFLLPSSPEIDRNT